jgi:ADP-dependent NAD(P)H-hydrate dehydratase / NAD(P)H-hydrate epimerase
MPHALNLYRADQARAVDRHAIDTLGVPGYTLMQRAGAAAFRFLQQRWPGAQRIGVACGSGNNGGDGYVLARLARASGCEVHVFATGPARADESMQAAAAWHEAGGATTDWSGPDAIAVPEVDVWVDGLLGIGLSRPPQGPVAELIDAINASGRPVLALDLPSGVDADRGSAPGAAIRADTTISFILAKQGLETGVGRRLAGERVLDGLGLPVEALQAQTPTAVRYRPGSLADWIVPRRVDSHKGDHGRVLCIGGEHGFGGAIRLAAEAALRCGSGLVSVATRPLHVPAILCARPELMVQGVDGPDGLTGLLPRIDVIALGPGLGTAEWGRGLWQAALASGKPCVLDADALNLLSAHGQALPSGCVLTPHPGEAARLLGIGVAEVEADRYAAAQALAQHFDAVVVLKGPGSIVAVDGQPAAVIDAGNPGMAVGGMGDVLTGVIASLMGQGLSPHRAALTGALLHAAAADRAATEGQRGLMPLDLMPELRRLVNPETGHG